MNTKIIATLGPKTWDLKVMKALVKNGLSIGRINFSHADEKEYRLIMRLLDEATKEIKKKVEIMFDLQGPRIRVGKLAHEIEMREGEVYTFLYNQGNIDNFEIPIDAEGLFADLKVGEPLYLANGDLELRIVKVEADRALAKVERGGLLMPRKAINLPQTVLKGNLLTKKDLEAINLALRVKPDYIALSFVQRAEDVKKLKKLIAGTEIKIIAKIERATALDDIDNIIRETDGIMVARGDLGIEMPLEDLPILQKNLIRHAHWHDKPAIVATQMMSSMVDHPRPTRAEVSDVANAIFDGADALMLSDETANGNYPVETIKMMKKVVDKTNNYFNNRNYFEDDAVIYKK